MRLAQSAYNHAPKTEKPERLRESRRAEYDVDRKLKLADSSKQANGQTDLFDAETI
jgi:hypothetical protein